MNKTLIELLICFRVAVTVVPIIGVYSNTIINITSFLLLYILITYEVGIGKVLSVIHNNILIFSIFFLMFISNIANNTSFFDTIYELFINLLWPLCFFYVAYSDEEKTTFRILGFTLICYVITSITTYIGCITFEGAARHMSNSNYVQDNPELINLYLSANIGTFTFIYSLVILFPLIIYIIRCQELNRSLFLIIAIIIIAVILKTEYSTALILLILSFALFFLPKTFDSIILIRFSLIIFVLTLLFSSVLPFVVDIIVSISGSEQVAERLKSLLHFSIFGQVEKNSDLEQRIELWRQSIDLFTSNVLFGSLNKSGGHSFIFDNMARFGLLGLLANIVIFRKMYVQNILPYKSSTIYGYILFCLVLNIIQCLVNPVINYFSFTFVIPLVAYYYDSNFEKSNKTKDSTI